MGIGGTQPAVIDYNGDPDTIRYGFDSENLTSIQAWETTHSFVYDSLNRTTTRSILIKDLGQTFDTVYTYDEVSNGLKTMTYPSGKQLNYQYSDGMLSGMLVNSETFLSGISYGPGNGMGISPTVKQYTFGNDLQEIRDFDQLGRFQGISITSVSAPASSQNTGDVSWGFDTVGNITSRDRVIYDNGGQSSEVYAYDVLNRVSRADYVYTDSVGVTETEFENFFYDVYGNMVGHGGNVANAPLQYQSTPDLYTYDNGFSSYDLTTMEWGGSQTEHDMNRDGDVNVTDFVVQSYNLHLLDGIANPDVENLMPDFVYDLKGRTVETPDGMTYDYDVWDRMTSYGGVHQIGYDGDSMRFKTWSEADPSQVQYRIFNAAGKPIAEYLWDGSTLTLLKENYYWNGQHLASDIISKESPSCPDRIWSHKDHLGSTRVFSDENGVFVGSKEFYAFGGSWKKDTQCLPLSTDFTGHLSMEDTDLVWMQARTYSPYWGRFLETDPIRTSSNRFYDSIRYNQYGYSRNNPINFIDLNGMDPNKPDVDKLLTENDTKLNQLHDTSKKDGGHEYWGFFEKGDSGKTVLGEIQKAPSINGGKITVPSGHEGLAHTHQRDVAQGGKDIFSQAKNGKEFGVVTTENGRYVTQLDDVSKSKKFVDNYESGSCVEEDYVGRRNQIMKDEGLSEKEAAEIVTHEMAEEAGMSFYKTDETSEGQNTVSEVK